MAPIRKGDGTELRASGFASVRKGDGMVLYDPAPADESFEHNNLSGNYGGDVGVFSIQSGTVDDGSYALFGDARTDYRIMVRDAGQTEWSPDLRVTWRQLNPDTTGNGSIAWASQSVSGVSSYSGYALYTDSPGSIRLDRWDNGSRSQIGSNNAANLSTGSWMSGQLDWLSDGTIDVTLDGAAVNTTDATYSEGVLGALAYNKVYIDNIQFEFL